MLATILRLRLAGCAAAAALLLVLHALGTLPALAPFIGLLLVTLAAGVLVDRRGTNDAFLTLAVVDTVVLLVAIHLGGGPEAAGLPFLVLPAIAFGGALPRRATILLTIAAAVALGLDFAAYDLGWMGGAVPAATHTATWSRYGAIVTVSALAAAAPTAAEILLPTPLNGQGSYAQNCAPCHGTTGKGDGPSASISQESWMRSSRSPCVAFTFKAKGGSRYLP